MLARIELILQVRALKPRAGRRKAPPNQLPSLKMQAETSPGDKPVQYRLKSMVIARILAEATVCLILAILPVLLLVIGQLAKLSITIKVVLFSLSVIGALFLPAYGFVTWLVEVRPEGLSTHSLFRQQRCRWADVKKITRRSNWNWLRYVVEHKGGELTFPVWLRDCDQLVATVRKHLDKGGGRIGAVQSMFRAFSQDPISIIFQLLQTAAGIGTVVVFWFFFAEIGKQSTTNSSDTLFVLAFCVIITGLCIWRSVTVALMPRAVQLTPTELIIKTFFFSRQIAWDKVKSITPSMPIMPEGFTIKTTRGSFLIGNGMDSMDELVEAIQKHCPPPVKEAKK
ncbi:MAG: PH domain-containing protein [Cyanobacteria bacterium]|nr:PH domain-containing protein [Cyanobacteriota bacterium]